MYGSKAIANKYIMRCFFLQNVNIYYFNMNICVRVYVRACMRACVRVCLNRGLHC